MARVQRVAILIHSNARRRTIGGVSSVLSRANGGTGIQSREFIGIASFFTFVRTAVRSEDLDPNGTGSDSYQRLVSSPFSKAFTEATPEFLSFF